MRSRLRPAVTALARSLGALTLGLVAVTVDRPAVARADTSDPIDWPTGAGTDPTMDASAHSLRIAGPDRYQTAQAANLMLHGAGGYPFTTSDRSPGADWWGLGTCPFAVIVTAGDTAADSLAAASLSDPTDRSSEPLLTRSAAADPFFDPIGASSRVDTEAAPVIVTASARQGASRLSPAAAATLADLAAGGCTRAGQAVIVGGIGAVPPQVDQHIVDLGFDEVFRVSGTTRYGTAAAVARALGTGAGVASNACTDPRTDDGATTLGFHGNAAPEYRVSTTGCTVLSRTVVLTDGTTGADALAAGWWTSRWQVPVLLVDGDGSLPPATRDALSDLDIDNLLVLGGTARVPDATADAAAAITGATVRRVAGANRYETSVVMAQRFGGWFPGGSAADHDGSVVCLAASSGSGTASVGWPDALGAGPWCAAAAGRPAPRRALPPTNGTNPRISRGLAPSHQAVPVLLTPAGAADLAPAVTSFLAGVFPASATWCAGDQADNGCLDPGFVVAFGGRGVLTDTAVLAAAARVSGRTNVAFTDRAPAADTAFWTALDLTPVYADGGNARSSSIRRACVDRDAVDDIRWLTAVTPAGAFLSEHDLVTGGRYVGGQNRPVCVTYDEPADNAVDLIAASLSGTRISAGSFAAGAANRLTLSGPVAQRGAEAASGVDTRFGGKDGTFSRLVFDDQALTGPVLTARTRPATVQSSRVELILTRGEPAPQPDTFTLDVSLTSSSGTLTATVTGEAVLDNGTWQLRGRTIYTGGTGNVTSGQGGFRADLTPNGPGGADDELRWAFDGLVAGP